jgi:hypothetical protein
MKIGYARVSSDEQHLGLQHDTLEAVGCAIIYQDAGISGIVMAWERLAQALSAIGSARGLETCSGGALAGLLVRDGGMAGKAGDRLSEPHRGH